MLPRLAAAPGLMAGLSHNCFRGIQLNLYKLRTCRNIAGVERQLEPYAAHWIGLNLERLR